MKYILTAFLCSYLKICFSNHVWCLLWTCGTVGFAVMSFIKFISDVIPETRDFELSFLYDYEEVVVHKSHVKRRGSVVSLPGAKAIVETNA